MCAFQWLMKKVTQVFSRSTNALFYSLLYRELLKEINEITEDEKESIKILREIGKKSGFESCERHSSIFKFMPGSPKKVLEKVIIYRNLKHSYKFTRFTFVFGMK